MSMVQDRSDHITPTVNINSSDLSSTQMEKLVRATVTTHLHLPDMFELVFEDTENSIIGDTSAQVGSLVEIFAGASGSSSAKSLIKAELTSIEGEYEGTVIHVIFRGYEKSHRLQRASRTRTFVDMTDADIANQIAQDGGFGPSDIDVSDTSTTHRHVSQIAQTDWEFLAGRAQEIGFETGVAGGKFYFRKASSAKEEASAMGMLSGLAGGGPPTLTFQDNLVWFRPRRSAANIPSKVEVRVYDYKAAEVVVGTADLKTGTAKLDHDPDPAALAGSFSGLPIAIPSPPHFLGLPDLGLPPSNDARLIVDRPIDWGSPTQSAVDEMAKGMAEHFASTVLEAEGEAYGDPAIQAGAKVTIGGVAEEFKGDWIVSAAHHVFVPATGGYSTRFEVTGRHDRSLLGLSSMGATHGAPPRLPGPVIGVVTNNNDPDTMGRVKLGFPWLSPAYESDWARVVQAGLGKEWGNLFLPEVGDEVLVGFEFGDARRPYVLGGLVNGKTTHPLSPLAPSPPTTGTILLGDADGKLQLFFDVVKGELHIVCDGGVLNPIGKIVIEQKSTGGEITVNSAGNITVEAANPGSLTLKGAMGVTIDGGTGQVSV